MPKFLNNLLRKFLIWKYKHISERQFVYFLSILVGLLAGLGTVLLKNFTHFIQEVLEGKMFPNIINPVVPDDISNEELSKIMEHGSYEISKSIVESIIKNLNTKKKHVHVISIFCDEDNSVYDLTLERKNFLDTLIHNLPAFEKMEDYEGCQLIQKTIKQLNT